MGGLQAGPSHAAELGSDPLGPITPTIDPNFVAGQIVGMRDDGYGELIDYDDQIRTFQLTGMSRIWKEGAYASSPLTTGDCVYGRGLLLPNAVLEVDDVWANISRVVGTLVGIRGMVLDIRGDDGRTRPLQLTDRSELENAAGETARGRPSHLRTDREVVAITYTDPTSRTVFASSVTEMAETQQADPIDDASATAERTILETLTVANGVPAERTSPLPGEANADALAPDNTSIIRKGNATFFCCGSAATRCGYQCPGATSGACGNCRGDRMQMAWPRLTTTGCDASCVGCCLPSDFEGLPCKKAVAVVNLCTNKSVSLTIADCGPNPRCQSTGCKGYQSVRFDLTPCAFTAIGGRLDRGIMNVRCSFTGSK